MHFFTRESYKLGQRAVGLSLSVLVPQRLYPSHRLGWLESMNIESTCCFQEMWEWSWSEKELASYWE